MKNGIAHKQNQDENLERLEAQREIYTSAKKITKLQLFLSFGIITLTSILAAFVPEINWLPAATGAVILILDFRYFNPRKKFLQEKAAKIQEKFDCEVLSIDWNSILNGQKPSDNDISTFTSKTNFNSTNRPTLMNWYPSSAESVPLEVGRLICQRTNLCWDGYQRDKYIFFTGVFFSLLSFGLIALSIIQGWTVQTLVFNVIIPCLPALLFLLKQIEDNKSAKHNLESLINITDGLLKQLLNGQPTEDMNKVSRSIQDGIYIHRKSSPLIFDWFYEKYRDDGEHHMNFVSEKYIRNYANIRGT